MKKLEIKVLENFSRLNMPLPSYATSGSAALDLVAATEEKKVLLPGSREFIPTGIAIDLKHNNLAAFLLPRSGLGCKHGIILGNSVGLIDSDYQGEIIVCLFNSGKEEYVVNPKDRIAQMMIVPVHQVELSQVEEFSETTARGSSGFGHTGK
jgi:dUTP pyrophosphatase